MGDSNFGIFIIIALLIVGGFFLFKDKGNNIENGLQSTSGDLIRTVPTNGGGSFTVTYSSNHSGQYAFIIEDSLNSGCKFSNGKQTYKSVMIGDGPTSQEITVTGVNCKFTGNYNLVDNSGADSIKNFGSQTVQ